MWSAPFFQMIQPWIYLLGIDSNPITTGPGPDGRPVAGPFEPTITQQIELPVIWMGLLCVISALPPAFWFTRRFRKMQVRGFPLD
jgi:hypothetical protein